MEKIKTRVLLAAVFSIACLGIALLVNGRAISVFADSDDDGIEDEVELRNSRVLEVEDELNSSSRLKIESHLEHSTRYGENNDSIEIKFDNSTGLKIEVSYNQNTAVNASFEIEFGIEFDSLINYTDDNADGRYDTTNDTQVDFTLLDSFTISYSATTIGGASGYKIVAIATNLNFTVIGYILQDYTLVNGSIVTPTEIMIDIIIGDLVGTNDYALKLALHTSSDDGSGTEYEYEAQTEDETHGHVSGEDGLQTGNSSSSLNGSFTWNQTALVDDSPHQVNMTLEDGGGLDDTSVYLCYEHGGEIVHDPKLLIEGIENAIPGTGNPDNTLIVVVVVIVIAASVIAVVFISRSVRSRKTEPSK